MSSASTLATSSLMLVVIMFAACPASAFEIEKRPDIAPACTASGVLYTRTTLYFGLARPAGPIR